MKSTNVKRLRNIMRICLLLVGVIVIGGSLFSIKSSAENNENYDVDSALIINDENDEQYYFENDNAKEIVVDEEVLDELKGDSLDKAEYQIELFPMQLIESSVNNYYVTLNNEVISSINDMNNGIINEDEYLSNMSKISEQLDSYEEIQLLNDEENNYKRSVNKRGIYSSLKALTPEEIELYAKHPIKAAKAKDCADYAETSTAKNWSGYTTWQGNGDAYRHALWSALMSKEIDNDFSYRVGLAHEGLKKGYNIGKQNDDTKMDISNNYAGRKVGDKSSKSRGKIAKAIKNKCCKGGLRRIRTYTKNKKECDYVLDGVMTKYVGYYVATSDGGSK